VRLDFTPGPTTTLHQRQRFRLCVNRIQPIHLSLVGTVVAGRHFRTLFNRANSKKQNSILDLVEVPQFVSGSLREVKKGTCPQFVSLHWTTASLCDEPHPLISQHQDAAFVVLGISRQRDERSWCPQPVAQQCAD